MEKEALASLIMFMDRKNGANVGGSILKKEEILEVEPHLERVRSKTRRKWPKGPSQILREIWQIPPIPR